MYFAWLCGEGGNRCSRGSGSRVNGVESREWSVIYVPDMRVKVVI